MMKKKYPLAVAYCVCMLTSTAFAVTDGTTVGRTYTLPVYTVTAQRMERVDLQTPASTAVFTEEGMKNTGAKNAFDAVNFVPGITSFSYGASGFEYGAMDSRVNIRGLERGSLILVNGAPYNLNGKGGLSSIPTESIDRIEVVKGASSVLYGAEALGGVVNVITKTPMESGGSATVSVGNVGQKEYAVSYGTPKVTVGVQKRFFGVQDPSTPIRTASGSKRYEYYTAREKGNQLGAFISAKLTDDLTFNYSHSDSDSAFSQLSTETNVRNRLKNSVTWKYKDRKNSASLVYKEGKTTGTLFYNDRNLEGASRYHNTNVFAVSPNNFKANQYGFDVQHQWDLQGSKDYVIAGLLGKRENYKTTSAPEYAHPHRNSIALYTSYGHTFNDQWSVIIGTRYTSINDPVKDQHVFMPQAQVLYTPTQSASWYINAGKAFTMPNLSDTFKTVKSTFKIVSGKNLKPEEGWNYELGYKHVSDVDSVKAALFYMDYKNFFDWAKDSDGNSTIRVNGGRFRNVGVELEYNRKFGPMWHGMIGASFSNPKQLKMNATHWVQANPKVQLMTGIHYHHRGWESGTSVNFVTGRLKNRDGERNSNLIQWNAYLGYSFNDHQSLRVDARNILNRHNVISHGDWEYWDEPFNYQVSYTQKF